MVLAPDCGGDPVGEVDLSAAGFSSYGMVADLPMVEARSNFRKPTNRNGSGHGGFFASLFIPGMMRRRLRILLALLIAAVFVLLWRYQPDLANHYWVFFWLVAYNFVFYQKISASAPAPYPLSLRELVFGDPNAERQRLMEKLHWAMPRKPTPQVCHAYAEAIAALKAHEIPAAKVTQ